MKKKQYNRIKIILAEKGVTNKKLAQALQVAQPTVSRWCTNDMQPSIETLYYIAAYLKIDVRELLLPAKA
jgi:transcriptional regulator with XRE-family HTH domain